MPRKSSAKFIALLNVIKDYPTEAVVRDLLIYFMDAAEDNPSRAYGLTSVLVALRDSPEAPLIQGGSLIQEGSSLAMAYSPTFTSNLFTLTTTTVLSAPSTHI